MAARIALVLRSGGEYTPEHVQRLAFQLALYAPDRQVVVLSDADVPGVQRIPLQYDWPGWWAKLELCRPDIEGDLLYFDLDTVILGPLDDILKVGELTMLADPYKKPGVLGSGVMYVPQTDRESAWARFIDRSERHMRSCRGGDQEFFVSTWGAKNIARWQDLVPGQFVSYKADVRGKKVPPDARVVYFHGVPRPWSPSVTEL